MNTTLCVTVPPLVVSRLAPAERERALAATLAELRRRFGQGAVMRLGDAPLQAEAISTGFPELDAALGVGGLPRGRIVDIVGPEMSGKTALCLHLIAEAQKQGGFAALVDLDHALDAVFAEYCGVDPDRLYVSQPDAAEEALEITDSIVRAGVDVVVIDSAAALVPRCELQGAMGDSYAKYGTLMSQALRKLVGPTRKNNCLLIFTNQLRLKPGAMFNAATVPRGSTLYEADQRQGRTKQTVAYGNQYATGGWALRFYAAARLELHRVQAIKKNGEVIGDRIRAVVKKNKVAPPFRVAEFELLYPGRTEDGP